MFTKHFKMTNTKYIMSLFQKLIIFNDASPVYMEASHQSKYKTNLFANFRLILNLYYAYLNN
jgi:hypothetical protein